MAHLTESVPGRDGFVAVNEEGSEFGFGCRGHDVLDDLGDGVDGAIVGRVSIIARQEGMAASSAACF